MELAFKSWETVLEPSLCTFTMKALLIDRFLPSLSQLQVSEHVPDPTISHPNEVLVRITHAGISHVDMLYAMGKHQNNHSGLVKPPFVLGLEFAGIVESVGRNVADVRKLDVGDLVWGGSVGGLAEKIVVKASQVRLVPSGLSLKDTAGLGAATVPVSYGALATASGADVKRGETVLIHAAAGALGVMAVQIARALVGEKGKVIGTVGSERKKSWLEQHEVLSRILDSVIRYDLNGWEAEVKKCTSGRDGVDVVFDTVGLVEKSIRCTRFGGRIVIAGFAGLEGKMERLAMNRVLLKNIRLIGYRFGELGRRKAGEHERVWEGLGQMLEGGDLKPIRFDKQYPGLESAREALEDLGLRRICGKAVVEIEESSKSQKTRSRI